MIIYIIYFKGDFLYFQVFLHFYLSIYFFYILYFKNSCQMILILCSQFAFWMLAIFHYDHAKVSKPEELPPKLLSEPCLTVSHHTAPSYLAVGVAPNFQCANIFEFSFAILSNHFVALFLEFLFLYFLLTHLIKHLFMYLSILYIAVL